MNILYEIFMVILSFISVYFAWVDYSNSLLPWQYYLDILIWIIFVIDYMYRIIKSSDKKQFIKSNIFDLLAIFPFNSSFRAFRSFKLLKFLRLMKMTKIIAFIVRIFNKIKRFLKTNGFQYMLLLSLVMVIISVILVSFFESMTLQNGIWWAFVTITTVGYGDIAPNTVVGRIVACVLMITGIGLLGSLTSTITTFFIKPQKDTISNDKIDMIYSLYNNLNDSEKEEFKKIIHG